MAKRTYTDIHDGHVRLWNDGSVDHWDGDVCAWRSEWGPFATVSALGADEAALIAWRRIYQVAMKCEIEWIDCKGNPTGHDAEAIGYAVLTDPVLRDQRFAICEEHKRTLDAGTSHHDAHCSHILPKSFRAPWRFEPLENS